MKSIILLTSGSMLAHIVLIVFTPAITRLFTPEEMGELGYFVRWATFISSIATARYELAIPLPKNTTHSFQIFRIALRIGLMTIAVLLACGLIYWLIDGGDLKVIFYILAVSFASLGIIFKTIGTNWAIKTKSFKRISASKLTEAFGNVGFKILAGVLQLGAFGLIIASILGIFSAALLFVVNFFKERKKPLNISNKKRQLVLMKSYSDFPKINLPHVMLDTGRELLLAIFMVELMSKFTFGSYEHSFRMLKIPLMLIGTSIGQVFFQRCSESFSNKEAIFPLLKRTTLILGALSIVPFGVIFFFGEEIFSWVFGEEWKFSGTISAIVAPWLMINFITSPVSTIPLVINKQKTFFILGLVGTIVQLVAFGLLPYLKVFNENQVEYFVIASWLMSAYLLLTLGVKLYLVKKSDQNLELLNTEKN